MEKGFDILKQPKITEYVIKRLVNNIRCNRCLSPVLKTDVPESGYSYQCLHCDEDLFEFEVHKCYEEIYAKEFHELLCKAEELMLAPVREEVEEMSFSEKSKIAKEVDRIHILEDVDEALGRLGFEADDIQKEKIADLFENDITKCDGYYEAYWAVMENSVNSILKKEAK